MCKLLFVFWHLIGAGAGDGKPLSGSGRFQTQDSEPWQDLCSLHYSSFKVEYAKRNGLVSSKPFSAIQEICHDQP
jgi:hypothetical protein